MKLDLNYQVDIAEQGFINGDFIIQGTAINAVVTSNNHKFLSEELQKSAQTLKGVPLLVDHENTVDSIKGRVLVGEFNEEMEKVDFKAKVMDEDIKELIKDGRLNTVSVGAVVEDIDEEDGVFIPRGITFKELSLVAVPADSGATFQIALKEAYHTKNDCGDYNAARARNLAPKIQLNKQEVKKMSEEQETETSTEPEAEVTKEVEEPKEEPKEEVAVEPAVTEEKVKSWVTQAMKSMKEADADEKPAEPEAKEEAKEKEEEAEPEAEEEAEEVAEEKYNVVRSSLNSYTLVR